jgi:hypothetical protein
MSASSFCPERSLLLTFISTIDTMNTTENRREERSYYIKLDNILSENPSLNRYHHIKATSGPDLLQKVITLYGFKESAKTQLQIWSSIPQWLQPSLRIDTLDTIPEGHEFLWLRAQSSSS